MWLSSFFTLWHTFVRPRPRPPPMADSNASWDVVWNALGHGAPMSADGPDMKSFLSSLEKLEILFRLPNYRNLLDIENRTEPELLLSLLVHVLKQLTDNNIKNDWQRSGTAALLRFLRNVCAGNVGNSQNVLRGLGALPLALKTYTIVFDSLVDESDVMGMVLRGATQFISNFATENSQNQVEAWDVLGKATMKRVVDCAIQHADDILLSSIPMLLFNLIVKNESRRLLLSHRQPGALRSMIRYVATNHAAHDATPKSMEWITRLLRVTFANFADTLQAILDASDSTTETPADTTLVMLNLFDVFLEDSQNPLPITETTLATLARLSAEIAPHVETELQSWKASLTSHNSKQNVKAPVNLSSAYVFAQIFFTISEKSLDIRRQMVNLGILDTLIRMLAAAYKYGSPPSNAVTKTPKQGPPSSEKTKPAEPVVPTVPMDNGFRVALIRTLSHLFLGNVESKTRMLEMQALPLVLNACRADDRNPFIREWAVLAIRNLCEDSDAIQQEISKLSPTGVENTPELNEMQVNVTLDPETGRVRIGQKQADSAT